jgi:hypothetical protein
LKRSPYTAYMSMCEIGIRWPNKDHDDTNFWNRYTIKTSQDTQDKFRHCGDEGRISCPEDFEKRDWGDQDCHLVKEKTLYMDELEANLAFCGNSLGHSVFSREAPHIWTGMYPLKKWENNEHRCTEWLEENGIKAFETISRRSLDAAEKGIPYPPDHRDL